jgi:hypothetical protein
VQKGAKIELPEGGWKQVLFFFGLGSLFKERKRGPVLKRALTDRVAAQKGNKKSLC